MMNSVWSGFERVSIFCLGFSSFKSRFGSGSAMWKMVINKLGKKALIAAQALELEYDLIDALLLVPSLMVLVLN